MLQLILTHFNQALTNTWLIVWKYFNFVIRDFLGGKLKKKLHIENRNFLAPQGFQLSIEKFPKVSFICQAVDIPGVRIPDIVVPNPFRDYSIAGTETEFEDLTVKFLIDELRRICFSVYNSSAKIILFSYFSREYICSYNLCCLTWLLS